MMSSEKPNSTFVSQRPRPTLRAGTDRRCLPPEAAMIATLSAGMVLGGEITGNGAQGRGQQVGYRPARSV
jgi:hypothetical protein